MLQYILETLAFQLAFLLGYDLFLKKETFFQWNRAYLLLTFLLSLVLPRVHFEALKTTVSADAVYYPDFLITNNAIGLTPSDTERNFWDLLTIYEWIFLLGVLVMTIWLFVKLYRIQKLRREGRITYFPKFTKITVPKSNLAFSFFKQVFIGDAIPAEKEPQILAHEMVHIKQWHSLDLIFFELMRIGLWFNPMVYVYQNRMAELHEFIADAKVAKNNKKEQYQLLLSEAFQTQGLSFVNQFFRRSLVKKRIVMLTKRKSKTILQLKYLLLLPLVMGMLVYSSCEREYENEVVNQSIENSSESDAALIAKIQKEIDGTLEDSLFYSMHEQIVKNDKDDFTILSKENFFRKELYLRDLIKRVNQKRSNNPVKDFLVKLPLPSSNRYKNYADRKKTFQILDENLKVSINQNKLKIRRIVKSDKDLGPGEWVVVQDISDLTGKEIIRVNQALNSVEGTNRMVAISSLDGKYSFLITNLVNEPGTISSETESTQTSRFSEHAIQEGDQLTFNVYDLNNLTEEEKEEQAKIFSYIENGRTGQLTIIDTFKNYKKIGYTNGIINNVQVSKDNFRTLVPFGLIDEVPIFPGCGNVLDKKACFQEKIQEHIRKNFNYPKAAQELDIQGRVNVMFTINQNGDIENIRKRGPHKLLEDEVERIIERLPKMGPGKHQGKIVRVPFSIPVTFKLSNDIDGFGFISPDVFDRESGEIQKTVARYNQLVTEVNRLLQHSSKENPVIKNLQEEIHSLKIEIQERLNHLTS